MRARRPKASDIALSPEQPYRKAERQHRRIVLLVRSAILFSDDLLGYAPTKRTIPSLFGAVRNPGPLPIPSCIGEARYYVVCFRPTIIIPCLTVLTGDSGTTVPVPETGGMQPFGRGLIC